MALIYALNISYEKKKRKKKLDNARLDGEIYITRSYVFTVMNKVSAGL